MHFSCSDLTTLNFERARFARVCVEVNLAKPLKGTILINGERYFVAYEGLSEICSKCGIYGHLVHGCPITITERLANLETQVEPQSSTGPSNRQNSQRQENGFIPARASRRVTQLSPRPVTGTTGQGSGEANRNIQVIPQIKETANIVVSKKYGSLGMDTNLSESREDIVVGEENKENQDTNIHKNKESRPGKEILIFGGKMNTKNGSKVETKETWPGNKNKTEGARGRPKKLSNKPVRGLIFGPTKGEISLSESGKRLRVEKLDAGRAGGVFINTVEEVGVASKTLQLRDEELENPMDSTISGTKQGASDMQATSQEEERVLSLA